MKKRYKILILIIVLAGGAVFAGSQFEPVKAAARKVVYNLRFDTGLVGYWSFDGKDMSGVTAYDRGSGGNNGTLTGGPVSTEGVVGQALNFTASASQRVDSSSFDLGTINTVTMSAWIKNNSATVSSQQGIMQKRFGVIEVFMVSNTLGVYIANGTAWHSAVSSAAYTDWNQWHNVVVVYNGSNVIIYRDGSVVATSGSETGNLSSSSNEMRIGWASAGGSTYWDGVIDEVRIYNRALSAAEIAYQYARTKPGGSGTVAKSVANNNGLVGYWDFDDCDTCTTVADRSDNGNTGTMYKEAGPTVGDLHTASGKIGRGVNFDGDNDYIDISNESNFDLTSAITLAGWVNPSSLTGNRPFVFKNTAYYVWLNTRGNIEWVTSGLSDTILTLSSGNLILNSWQYLVFTYDGATKNIYINGTLRASEPATGSISTNSNDVLIGRFGDSSFYSGSLDDIRIYNRALSSAEIKNLYASTQKSFINMPQNNFIKDGLVGNWSFNGQDMSGVTAIDRSGSGNNGTLTGGPVVEEGVIGQALSFDGSNDYSIMAPDDTNFTTGSTGTFSFSFWIKPTTGSNGTIISRRHYCNNDGHFRILAGSPSVGNISLYFYSNLDDVPGTYSYSSGNILNYGKWNHIVITKQWGTAGATKLYLDGVSQTFTPSGSDSAKGTSYTGLQEYIGAEASASAGCAAGIDGPVANFFNGPIDEVRIYNRILSAAEVLKLYNAGKR